MSTRTLNNAGTVDWTNAGTLYIDLGATFNNAAGALFLAEAGISLETFYGTGTFNNAGTFRKTGSGTTVIDSGLAFSNTGTVDIQGGTLELDGSTSSGTITIASAATLKLVGATLTSTSTISGAGSVEFASGGTSTLAGTISASGGVTIDSGATVSAAGGATISTDLTSNGTLNVGGSGTTGVLTVSGNFTMGGLATLNMDVHGTTAGSGFDQLQIGGTASLAGTLNVSLGSYTPSTGSTFALLSYGSHTGTFGTISSGSTSFTPHYNSGDFTLQARADVVPEEDLPPGNPDEQKEAPVVVAEQPPRSWQWLVQPAAPVVQEEDCDAVFATLLDEPAGAEEPAWLPLADVLQLPLAVLEALLAAVV